MKLITAFLRLIRWPNLFFIAFTQIVFYVAVYSPLTGATTFSFLHDTPFVLLMAASVLIAAGGYIINDYFDLQIDKLNKPEKVVVDNVVKRRWAIMWHLIFSIVGLLLSAWVAYGRQKWMLLLLNFISVLLLWLYSTTFKKRLLIGNVVISLLTAWVILVVYLYLNIGLNQQYVWQEAQIQFDVKKFFKLTIVYAGFAFIMSLIREVVKDIEDMMGDARFGCTTMPIRWGVPVAKMFAAVWIVVAASVLFIIQLYAWQSGWRLSALYCIVLLVLPLLWMLRMLYKANVSADYHKLSSWLKWVMLVGILSMLFFKIYT